VTVVGTQSHTFYEGMGGWASAVAFEELHGTLVLFSRCSAREGAEVAPSSGLWVDLARVEAVLSGLQLANHDESSVSRMRFTGSQHPGWLFRLLPSIAGASLPITSSGHAEAHAEFVDDQRTNTTTFQWERADRKSTDRRRTECGRAE